MVTVSADCYIKAVSDTDGLLKCITDSAATETCSAIKAGIWCSAHPEGGCTWDDVDKAACTASDFGDCDATCDGAATLAVSAVAVAAVMYNM